MKHEDAHRYLVKALYALDRHHPGMAFVFAVVAAARLGKDVRVIKMVTRLLSPEGLGGGK